jgi:transcriptional regulator with PAS, ATPase and Fis domain
VNCAAIPSELAEAELFGHEPGAFTGAGQRRRGRLEIAEGGTLLLNEIGELPLDLQAKLLSFLDDMSFTRVGGEKTIHSDIRIIAATNRNLEEDVSAGRFRKDLFYRLNVFFVEVPPLRKRVEDIPRIVSELLEKLATDMQLQRNPVVHPDTMEALLSYDWPGNVRELRNVLERALILSRGGALMPRHLQLQRTRMEEAELPSTIPPGMTLPEFLTDVERRIFQEVLTKADGNKRAVARALGISRFTVARRIDKLGLSES